MLAPIVLFVYKRPLHTEKTIEALKKNRLAAESVLYIYSDAAKDEESRQAVADTRKFIQSVQGFKEIIVVERDKNWGLANSVIAGVSEIIQRHKKVIVLEDDIVTSVNFLQFMNQALDAYAMDQRIFSVSGYSYPIQVPAALSEQVYLSQRASSWGWATWEDRWNQVDWEMKDQGDFIKNSSLRDNFDLAGDDLSTMLLLQIAHRIDSWAIRFAYSAHRHKAFHLFPVISKAKNIGHDNSGTHSRETQKFEVMLDDGSQIIELPPRLEVNDEILRNSKIFFKKTFLQKLYNRLRLKFPQVETITKYIKP